MDFMIALEKFLRTRFKYKTQLTIKCLGSNIAVSRHSVELYLRFKPKHYSHVVDRPIVIAKMYFSQRKKGHGTALLNFLIDLADEFDLGSVVLESTNTASTEFAKKRGFIRHPTMRNTWQVSIENLSSFLTSKNLRR